MNSDVKTDPRMRRPNDVARGVDDRVVAEPARAPSRADKPLPALFSDLAREVVDLIRKELALARAEVSEKVTSAQRGAASLAVGAAVALGGMIMLLLAAANALAMALPPELAPWLAPLLVGGVVLLIGYGMLKSGQSRLKAESFVPDRTVNSLRADRAVVEEKTR